MRIFNSFCLLAIVLFVTDTGCHSPGGNTTVAAIDSPVVRLITLDPGHFHAALVQKSMSDGIDSFVQVYAPGGPELQSHLNLIKQYNERSESPAHWVEQVYTGSDFLEKMIELAKDNYGIDIKKNFDTPPSTGSEKTSGK